MDLEEKRLTFQKITQIQSWNKFVSNDCNWKKLCLTKIKEKSADYLEYMMVYRLKEPSILMIYRESWKKNSSL